MVPIVFLVLSFCFQKSESAQITPSFSGMTCPTNWAAGLTNVQIDITDPATGLVGDSTVILRYQTSSETKSCVIDITSTTCGKNIGGCTDTLFSSITCTPPSAFHLIWMAPASITAEPQSAVISITNIDGRITGWSDGTYTLNVIYGPNTIDENAETASATHVYNDVAEFTCSSSFTGSSFERMLSACGEWTKRSTDAVNGCTAISGSSNSNSNSNLTEGQIIAIAICSTVGAVAIVGVIVLIYLKHDGVKICNGAGGKKDKKANEKHGRGSRNETTTESERDEATIMVSSIKETTTVSISNVITTVSDSNETPQ